MADSSQVKEITDKLEQGVKDLFESDAYADYLKTMSRFHKYSTRNTLLIHMQKPDATVCCGFRSWQVKFGRSVNKGEKAIKILAPAPFTVKEEKEKLDPVTRLPVLDDNGMPVIEYTERQTTRFKVVNIFDVGQTSGKPLPSLVQDLTGNVEQYAAFMDALRDVSPLPIVFENLPSDTDGLCRFGREIAIREGMSEIQTVCAVIHELTHAKLHDLESLRLQDANATPKDCRTEELEAEALAFSVCTFFNIETDANSFGYIAEYCRGRELKELNAYLGTVRKTASELIDAIDGKFQEIAKERNIVFSVGEEQSELAEPISTTGSLYTKYCNVVAGRAAAYAVSSATLLYTDEVEGRRACDQIASRVVNDMLLESGEHYPLYTRYMDNPDFKARLEDYVFIRAYLEPSAKKEDKNRLGHELYEKLGELFPDFMDRKFSYLRFESNGLEPLSLEWVFGDRISVMHTYSLNGDLCYDPMIEFIVNSSAKTLAATVFEQSIPPLYQYHDSEGVGRSVDGNGNSRIEHNLRGQISEFSVQWFQNISEQGFIPVKATLWNDGGIDDVDVSVTFDKDGNMVTPEPEKPHKEYSLGYGFLGNGITVWNRAEEQNGDYATVAHIATDRTVTFYDKDMPHEVRKRIDTVANSPDTWAHGYAPAPENIPPRIEGATAPTSVFEAVKRVFPEEPTGTGLDMSLPDPLTSAADRDAYGYTYEDMLPVSNLRAVELFDTDHCIYLLYPDDTESMALDHNEILDYDGLCGIERMDWERSPVRAAQIAVAANAEGNRESELLYGDGNRFGIYQIRDGIEDVRDYRFASMMELEEKGLPIDRANYALAYTAPFPERIEFLSDRDPVLNRIYENFNINHPADYLGRSVSNSDVIVLKYNGDISAHYADSVGFKELDNYAFFGEDVLKTPIAGTDTGRFENGWIADMSAPSPPVPSVAELEADARAGKTISILDLSKAVHTERGNKKDSDTTKPKPTLMEKLDEGKRRAARQGQADAQKNKAMEERE